MSFNPAAILYDSSGNAIDVSASSLTGTERGVVVRNIPLGGLVSAGNSTTAILGANGVFTGTSVDCLNYASVSFSASSDVVSAVAGIELQWSPDNANWSTRGVSDLRAARTGANQATDLHVRTHDRYFRIKYTNGATPQTFFRLQVMLHTFTVSGDGKGVDQIPVSGDDVQLVKAVLAGKRATSEGSGYADVTVDNLGNLKVTPSSTHSAFGSMLVAQETVRVNVQFPYSINSRLVNTTTANGGTVTWDTGRAKLSTSVATNGSAKMESRDTIKYTPGQGVICRFTAVFATGTAGCQQEIGIGDDLDGFFFGYNGTSFGVLRRVGGVDNWIPQASWNGDDKFDGTGMNATVLDPTKGYPYQIQFQWLGYGAIRFYIEEPYTGDFVLVHTIRFAGTSLVPSVNNPSLPVHAKITKTSGASDLTMYTASMGAIREGLESSDDSNVRWSYTLSQGTIPTGGVHLYSIQNKATNVLGGTNTNRVKVHIDQISIRAASTKDLYVALVLNATIGTPSWTDVNTASSVSRIDLVGTITNGTTLITFSVAGGTTDTENITDYNIVIAPGETLTIMAYGDGATSAGRVGISWHEEF